MAISDSLFSAFKGAPYARAVHRRALAKNPDIMSGIAQLQKICPADEKDDRENPVFIFSAGWRSGSTLLQRLIMSRSEVLIWGEPYDYCGLIQALADTVKPFTDEWPPRDYYHGYYNDSAPEKLTSHFIANLFPSLDNFRRGHRAFFDTMFAEPAKRIGVPRWGIKEVRLGVEHALYLRWLYPKASFIFLYRNPLDAYRSYCRYGRSWYKTWPDEPVFTPGVFGEHWRKLVDGFLQKSSEINALVISYEDLVKGTVIHKIEQHLGIGIDSSVLEKKVGSSMDRKDEAHITRLEKWLLRRAVGPAARKLGYIL